MGDRQANVTELPACGWTVSAVVSEKVLNFDEMNSILLAVHNFGTTMVHKKIAALIFAINDPSIQELFEAAGIKTTIQSAADKLETTETPPDSPILPHNLFEEQTSRDKTHLDRQKKLNFWPISTEPMEEEAFKFTKKGKTQKNTSGKAAQMAKLRQVTKIRTAIFDSRLSLAQQIVALRNAANHPQLQSIVKIAGLVIPDESQVAMYHKSQQKVFLKLGFSNEKKQGCSNDDK